MHTLGKHTHHLHGIALQALAGSSTGVFVGCIWLEFGDLLAQHGASGSAFAVTGNGLAFLGGRVSFAFGFTGPCVPTNTGTQHSYSTHSFAQCQHMAAKIV